MMNSRDYLNAVRLVRLGLEPGAVSLMQLFEEPVPVPLAPVCRSRKNRHDWNVRAILIEPWGVTDRMPQVLGVESRCRRCGLQHFDLTDEGELPPEGGCSALPLPVAAPAGRDDLPRADPHMYWHSGDDVLRARKLP